jgi:tetratricopeptide (TPR) repeat protein
LRTNQRLPRILIALFSINLLFVVSAFAQTDPKPSRTETQPDSLEDLRAQIETTANRQEKTQLQMKLVEKLALNSKQAALDELHTMAAEDRFDPQTFYNIGNAFGRLGDSDGAVAAYRKAMAQRKGNYSRALNNLGVVLMRQGLWAEANQALTSALQLESFHYAEASYNLGRLYAVQGQMDLAVREWRRAVQVNPDHNAAAQALRAASADGRVSIASQPKVEKPETGRSVAAAAPRPARPSDSAKTLTVDPLTYNQLQQARIAHEQGKDQESVVKYRSVISRQGGYFAPANLELSYVLIGLKQTTEALANLQAVTTRDGGRYPISYYHLARLYELKGDLGPAGEAYSQAAQHFQNANPQFLLDISRVREKRGDFKGALAALEEYLTAMSAAGSRPTWSDERLAYLRQKVSESESK